MRDLIHANAGLFLLAKVSLVSMGLWILWRRRAHRLAIVGICIAVVAYYALLLYHLQIMMVVVLGPGAAPSWLLAAG